MIVVDIDRFRELNHLYGFDAADEVLRVTADRMSGRLRSTDILARIGADVFLIVLGGPIGTDRAVDVAVRLLETVAFPIRIDGHLVSVTACAGIALDEGSERDATRLVRRAEEAAVQAKARGRNRVTISSPDDLERRNRRAETERALQQAFERRQLTVHYQPEYSLRTRAIVGTEALVRWSHPERGLLTADEFVGIAEESDLIGRMGTWILGQAMHDAQQWSDAGHLMTLRVNLSTRQLVDDTIVIDLRTALSASDMKPTQVCLEVTESRLIQQVDRSVETLNRLKNLGVRIALDDFATGYSSMAYLRDLPVDTLKIDRSFVAGLGVDAGSTAIVSSIIQLGRELDLEVVAEGIESEHHISKLIELGCDQGQGFYLARPMPADELSQLLAHPAGYLHDAAG